MFAHCSGRWQGMRASIPAIYCDYDGLCDEWEVDYYKSCAYSVGSIRITETERAPGWLSDRLNDYCPNHKETREP